MKSSGTREYLFEALQGADRTTQRRRLDVFMDSLPWTASRRRVRRALGDISFGANSYLRTSGWLRSRREKAAVDSSGKPLPWFTYASINFVEPRLDREMRVFEYGSGASTLWWATKVKAVVSCEYDATWHQRMSGMIPANVRLIHAPDRGTYARQILESNDRFDIVVIDAECRVECARTCVSALKPEGIIIWDNSDRTKYQEGFDFLTSLNFRRLDFAGMGPIDVCGWSTSVFYRTHNCLGI
ncbi:MAG: FkbM family methyltransferase [Steroidobacteraceae bacterium]